MKNIKPYSRDAFTFHKSIVFKSLNKGNIKTNIIANETIISKAYLDYNDKFENNKLFLINPYGFDGEDKSNLLKLYSSQRKSIVNLKIELTTNEFNQRINTCPNCTIEKVSSLDHFIPKDEFPEFSVNPINLIPCCSNCNSIKKDNWRVDHNLLFINLYSDIIPKTKYLFVDIYSKTEFKFKLENKCNIDENIFRLIESHYSKLNLLQRFKENSDEVISELDILISSFKNLINDDKKLLNAIEKHFSKIETLNGINNWKIVLVKAMINSTVYF